MRAPFSFAPSRMEDLYDDDDDDCDEEEEEEEEEGGGVEDGPETKKARSTPRSP
jgi:hypothetical protein